MDILIQDIRYAIRKLARTRGFTLVVLTTLALAIGVTTAVFSVVNSVLVNPLKFARPDRLVLIQSISPAGKPMPASPQDMIDYRDQSRSFVGMAAVEAGRSIVLTRPTSAAVRLNAARVGAPFFSLLGVETQLGRAFAPGEDSRSSAKVAILSDAAWRRYFGADARIVGQRVTLDGSDYEVVGVAPRAFVYPENADVWYPAVWGDYEIGDRNRGSHSIVAIARLKDGVSIDAAQRDVQTIALRIARDFPKYDAKVGAMATSLRQELIGDVERPLWAMFGAVGFVLLIACANVANLLLVRAASRESEIAVRTALGAGRRRLIRQLVTESMLLAVAGAALGVVLAGWLVDAVVALGPSGLPRIEEIAIDDRVLVFTALVALATGLFFGLVPAFHASRTDISRVLHAATRGSGGGNRTRSAIVVGELSLAVVLLVGAGLLIRSFNRLIHVDPGFRAEHLIVYNVALASKKYEYDAGVIALTDEVQRRLAALPGTVNVAVAADRPIDRDPVFSATASFTVDGRPKPAPGSEQISRILPASPSFFQTMGTPIRRGRAFTDAENRLDAAPVVLVNEEFAKRYFPNEDPIGKHITFGISHPVSASPGDTVRAKGEIIGVTKNILQSSLAAKPFPAAYLPFHTAPFGATFLVRTNAEPTTAEREIRRQMREVDRDVPIFELGTMDDAISQSVWQPRFYTILLMGFGGIALLLAALGIYGVVAYAVSQRTREFGIRIALGATSRDVSRLVVGRGLRLTIGGIGLGVVAAVLATRAIRALLFGIDPLDTTTFGSVALLLATVAAVASWLPARRASRVDPVIAMRAE